jgi:surface antigen
VPAGRGHGASAAVVRVAILLVVVGATCYQCLPFADARDGWLRRGPSAGAYPWDGARGLLFDPWGFVARQCTSYVAWYLNAHGVPFGLRTRGPAGEGLFTSASDWDRAARAAGFAVRSTPVVGSIAQWDAGESSPPPRSPASADDVAAVDYRPLTARGFGHVAVVQQVFDDGVVVISEYNGADGTYRVLVTRAPRYLYIGVGPDPRRSAVTDGRADAVPGRPSPRTPPRGPTSPRPRSTATRRSAPAPSASR